MGWGLNSSGQLGDGTTIQRTTPVAALDLTNVRGIVAGSNHSVALTGDGRVRTAGSNTSGQLGDGTTTNRSIFLISDTGLSSATLIAAGGDFSLAA